MNIYNRARERAHRATMYLRCASELEIWFKCHALARVLADYKYSSTRFAVIYSGPSRAQFLSSPKSRDDNARARARRETSRGAFAAGTIIGARKRENRREGGGERESEEEREREKKREESKRHDARHRR